MIDMIRGRSILCAMLLAAGPLFGAQFLMGQADSSPQPASPLPDIFPDVPKYEVATIKPSTGASEGKIMLMFTPDGVSMIGVQVQMLLREAFRVEDDRIIGAPGWVKTNRYDVQAKVSPEDAPKLEKLKMEERRSMLVPLLVERFNLKYHHETREMTGYALVVAKGGPKMKVSDVQPPPPDAKPDSGANSKPGDAAPSRPQQRRMLRFMGRGHLEAEGSDTQMLARVLSQQLGRTVI